MERNPLKSLDIIANPLGTGNALHCIDNVNTMEKAPAPRRVQGKEAEMETTRKLIRIEGLAATVIEALRAIRRLQIAWAATHHVGCMVYKEVEDENKAVLSLRLL